MSGPRIANRVQETSVEEGTGTFELDGPVTGYKAFVDEVGDGNTCWYCIAHAVLNEWEIGIGTVAAGAPDTLARTTVIEGTNGASLVNFSAGQKRVFVTLPAQQPVMLAGRPGGQTIPGGQISGETLVLHGNTDVVSTSRIVIHNAHVEIEAPGSDINIGTSIVVAAAVSISLGDGAVTSVSLAGVSISISGGSVSINAQGSGTVNIGDSEDALIAVDQDTNQVRITAGSGVSQAVIINGLPSSDPMISNALWNDSGTVKISAG